MITIPLVGAGLLWMGLFIIVSGATMKWKREVRVSFSITAATVITGLFFLLLGFLDGSPGTGALCGFVLCPIAGLVLSYIYLRKLF